MAYTSINKGSDYFNTKLYTGNGSSGNGITGVNFQPDWVWIKDRGQIAGHQIFDAVRGATKRIQSDNTSAEVTNDGVSSFDSDGFTLGSNSSCNENTQNFVAWNWLAGNGTSSNTDGDVTATVSANQTSGFSIVKYVNPASGSPFTVGHGLGSAPKMIIIKNTSGVQNWGVWHTSIGFGNYLILNSANATASANLVTATSSTTFSTYQNHHSTGVDLIAYCFAEKKGFSKFGSYTGNGNADGTFVYTGFKPAFVLVKLSSGIQGWGLFDNKRIGYNPRNNPLVASDSVAEYTSGFDVDILSNGFKARTTDALYNYNGGTYIYLAFAEHPLVSSTGVPCTAR